MIRTTLLWFAGLALTAAPIAGRVTRPVGPEVDLFALSETSGSALVEVTACPNGDALIAVLDAPRAGVYRLVVARWRAGGEIDEPVLVAQGRAPLQSLISRPDLETDADGNWVVVWTALRPDVPATGVNARLFDANDRPRGQAFLVSGSGPRARSGARVAMAEDGSFTVGFTAAVNDAGTANDLFARDFDADGRPIGSPFPVNVPGPDLSELGEEIFLGDLELQPDGTLIAVWESYQGEGDLLEVFLRRFDSQRLPLDPENRRVNSSEDFRSTAQGEPSLAVAGTGDFLVAFRSTAQDGSGDGVVARRYAPSGEALGEDFVVNEVARLDQVEPDVAATPGGGFLVAWLDVCDLAPECTSGSPGNNGGPSGVFARALDENGLPLAGDVQVSLATERLERAPRIAAGGGVVAAVWVSFGPGGAAMLRGRRFAAPCDEDGVALCLQERFRARVEWQDPAGRRGVGEATASRGTWGSFAFFLSSADDLIVKVLDASGINGRYWVYVGSLSDVEFDLRVLDTASGRLRLYRNPPGRFASFGDVDAFLADGAVSEGPGFAPARSAGGCAAGPTTACLLGGRIEVAVSWSDGRGEGGGGRVLSATEATGTFWFFGPDNPEVVVKVLDGRAINDRFWVYVASLSNVELQISVRDVETGRSAVYRNPLGAFASFGDVDALEP